MSETARARAEAEQRAASDPQVSAFVSASAGSGKTKLLTDRLLRLMLAGAEPGRIQCLTFTKAGAAEMAVRLQRRVGDWVTATDAELDTQLVGLALEPGDDLRKAARCLFARVLDLPGGMRIGTIHAFCQSLLRRFPLEAALSPHFELLDEPRAKALRTAAREAVLQAASAETVALISPQLHLEGFAALLRTLDGRRDRLEEALEANPEGLEAAQRRVLGLGPDETEDDILRRAITAIDLPGFRAAMGRMVGNLNSYLKEKVPAAQAWLATAPPAQLADWHDWARYFLRADGEACDHSRLVSAPLEKAHPGLRALLLDEQERVCAVLARLRTAQVARLSAGLMRLALPALEGYAAQKRDAGWLDYADLIVHARALLREPGAAWVLYKLDGGLDHLLLDEVQDTAPDQWRIADALTAEFFAGEGARPAEALPRSIFAVGDRKQSIFSFQGAAPEGFDFWRDRMRERTEAAGGAFANVTLDVSFRSTAPVLALVDAVFTHPARMGAPDTAGLHHVADRADHAGRVEIWPLAPRPAPVEAAPWSAPDATQVQASGPQLLAEAVAGWIAGQTDGSVMLESRGRPLHAGDILVLVRSRGSFDRALLRALKDRHVPVAGLDRMVLTEQPAVADLLALCEALLLPEDELVLATVLTSPLGGLSDESLMDLALGRQQALWPTLRARAAERADWQAAQDFLDALFGLADFITPHALLSEALGRLGGRARLFGRLGKQADEPIDELLAAALTYARQYPPSLQGFLHWLREAGSEVTRQSEGAGRELRIMTVHGAKGLQAPMVILPATTGLSDQRSTLVWAPDPVGGVPVPLWGPRKDAQDAVMRQTLQAAVDQEREEHFRLLYVALTRAEDRLVVCGWEPHRAKPDCWYDAVLEAFGRLGAVQSTPFTAGAWGGEVLSHATPQLAAPVAERMQDVAVVTELPGWMGAVQGWRPVAPLAEPVLPASLAPSRPQDAGLGAVPGAASPLALRDASGRRFRRGQLLHSLLQHLPAMAAGRRRTAAMAWLGRAGTGITPDEAGGLVEELMALLDDPALAPLFGAGSRAEVPLTGVVQTPAGPRVVGGLVDRLVELPDAILVADYKTNREPPRDAAATPGLYLGQMAAYRAVLRAIFPGKEVRCCLIWTRAARADWLDEAVLNRHAPDAQPP